MRIVALGVIGSLEAFPDVLGNSISWLIYKTSILF